MSRYAAAHATPQGPGDARPTALQILKDEGLEGKLGDKVFVVTGGSSGIGIETVRALHATHATIFATARSVSKGQAVADDILASDPSNKAPIHVIKMELDSLESVKEGANDILTKSGGKVNVLVNNAGVMATPFGLTKDGFETQFGTNHVGHFLLFQLLKDALLASATPEFPSRVVSVSSTAHRNSEIRFDDFNFAKDYDPWAAYGQAKTANIYFANEIERRYGARNLHATSLHPGLIQTGLQAHIDLDAWGFGEEQLKLFKSPEQGAATSVYAAVGQEWAHKGGKFLADCVEQGPLKPTSGPMSVEDDGYASWAFDETKEGRLWKESLKMVGLQDDV
ncbi:Short-chain dehydrogenase/reductase SDR [Macrophomina phaseolina MS6]|uniref:Short-chain dehydrogenase/reductase SDR n=1 Tax=Macrophomina phaseolina (strain MS6) TaxID=1126212 RepID=K2RDW0_MACPH|nr:Short-chain dehydrogenase/reductase SDR [Macrophomina phaseolina MS6]